MTFNNQKQLSQFEDDLFNLALLGLLEIEGRALVQEDEQLRKSGGYDDIPAAPKSELAKIERMLRRQQIKKKVTTDRAGLYKNCCLLYGVLDRRRSGVCDFRRGQGDAVPAHCGAIREILCDRAGLEC